MLFSDPALKIMEAQLIGSLRVPRSTHVSHPNMLDAIRGLIQLLQDVGFAAESFDENALLESDLDEVIAADRSLREKLAQSAINFDPATKVIKPLDEYPIEYNSSDREITPTAGTPKSGHTRSSQYASVTSDPGSVESLRIQSMSLGQSGALIIRNRNTSAKARSADPPTLQLDICNHVLQQP